MAWVQVNRQRLEETMYVAFSQLLYLWDLEEQRGRGFNVIIRREGEKPQKEELFMGSHKKTSLGADHWTSLSGITDLFQLLVV